MYVQNNEGEEERNEAKRVDKVRKKLLIFFYHT